MSFDPLIDGISKTLGKALTQRYGIQDIEQFIRDNLLKIFYEQQGLNIYLNPIIRKWMVKDTMFVVKSNREHYVVGKLNDGCIRPLTESDKVECERLGIQTKDEE